MGSQGNAASVLDYVTKQSGNIIDELYLDSRTCQAVFRSLTPLAKQLVMRLLYIHTPVPLSTVKSWIILPDGQSQYEAAQSKLTALKVFVYNKQTGVQLNQAFQKQLQNALSQSTEQSPWKMYAGSDHRKMSTEQLDAYTKDCWDKILHFMIGSENATIPSDDLIELLHNTRLMQQSGEYSRISNEGFQFLLRDSYSQVWNLLLAFIENAEARGYKRTEVLCFLFHLSFLQFGKAYSIESLSVAQRKLLNELREYGLIYLDDTAPCFYGTRLGINLCSGEQYGQMQQQEPGYIVVETNYRVYAYTSSTLQIAILGLFVSVQYRLANLAVGVISRESVRQALLSGITSEQILKYLQQHAHPQTLTRSPIIPETVADQIKLWQAERDRVALQPGVLYNNFASVDAFKKSEKYAKDLGIFIWSNAAPDKLLLFVTEAGHDQMRAWMKKNL